MLTKNRGPIKGKLLLIWEIRTRSRVYVAGEHKFMSDGCREPVFVSCSKAFLTC